MNEQSEKKDYVGAMISKELKKKLQIYLIAEDKDFTEWLIEQINKQLDVDVNKTE